MSFPRMLNEMSTLWDYSAKTWALIWGQSTS